MKEITLNEFPPDLPLQVVEQRCTAWRASIVSTIKAIGDYKLRHVARRRFEAVEARVLKDIGISEAHRFIEVNKTFWES